jgi:predicted nucleic acid-binding protein
VIVLDTNVFSELFRPRPNDAVVDWIDRTPSADVFLTAVTVGEVRYGIERMPGGRRQLALAEFVEQALAEDFDGKVLPFDVGTTAAYAFILGARNRAGRPMSKSDAQIAATCLATGSALATRNTREFEGVGLDLINPFEPGARGS